jgi:hypothetical protein
MDGEMRIVMNSRYAFRATAGNWQNLVFARFAEAAEVTAVQRGCERWRP